MSIADITEWLVIGILGGMFATFMPALGAHAFHVIMSIIKNA